jgi:hypothetical protein
MGIGAFVLGAGLPLNSAQAPDDHLQELYFQTEASIEQISLALTHTLFAWGALRRGDGESGRTHIHYVINIIEGPQGEHFDPAYGGPDEGIGDGVGALVHAKRLLERLQSADRGEEYLVAAENAMLFLEWATSRVLSALELLDVDEEEAVAELRRAQGLLMAARGSREEKNRPTEGGARTILAWLEDLPENRPRFDPLSVAF